MVRHRSTRSRRRRGSFSRTRRKKRHWLPPFFLYVKEVRRSMSKRSMKEVVKKASLKWKYMTAAEKYKYIKKSERLGKPKRMPISPFILYFVRFQKKRKGRQMKEVAKEAGICWKKMTKEQRLRYSALSLNLWRKQHMRRSISRFRSRSRSARRSFSRRRHGSRRRRQSACRSRRRKRVTSRSGRRSRSSGRSTSSSRSRSSYRKTSACRSRSRRMSICRASRKRSAHRSISRKRSISGSSKRYRARRRSASRKGRRSSPVRRKRRRKSEARRKKDGAGGKSNDDKETSKGNKSECEKSAESNDVKCKPECPGKITSQTSFNTSRSALKSTSRKVSISKSSSPRKVNKRYTARRKRNSCKKGRKSTARRNRKKKVGCGRCKDGQKTSKGNISESEKSAEGKKYCCNPKCACKKTRKTVFHILWDYCAIFADGTTRDATVAVNPNVPELIQRCLPSIEPGIPARTPQIEPPQTKPPEMQPLLFGVRSADRLENNVHKNSSIFPN